MKKVKIGDIFEIETKKGKAYLQYVKEAENERSLETSRVFYALHEQRPVNLEIITESEFFFMEFPLTKLGNWKGILNIGNVILPKKLKLPRYFRDENPFGEGWEILDNEGKEKRKVVLELNKEEKKLSPSGMWTLPLLQENLENGWRLENWV